MLTKLPPEKNGPHTLYGLLFYVQEEEVINDLKNFQTKLMKNVFQQTPNLKPQDPQVPNSFLRLDFFDY